MRFEHCPSSEELEALVVSERRRQAIMRHALSCPACREKLQELQAEAGLASQLKSADATAVSRRKRSRLVAICRHAADEAIKNSTDDGRSD